MTSEGFTLVETDSQRKSDEYDPFVRGPLPVGVRTIQARDRNRNRVFPCEIWYPTTAQHAGQDIEPTTQDVFTVSPGNTPRSQMAVRDAPLETGTFPLIIFSHPSGGNRRSATFLCTHLTSHGYVVAALNHSEVVAAELARRDGETAEQKMARQEAWISNRVPDIDFLLDHLLSGETWNSGTRLDLNQIGIVGHSFGGWTALSAIDGGGTTASRIGAVVALAPGGSSQSKPGMLKVKLSFSWDRDVPTLYLVADNDTWLPLSGMYELFDRTPATKQMVILRRADHMHFMDNVEEMHEAVREFDFSGELAWLPKEMRPISELSSGQQAHLFVRGLTLCHFDAILRRRAEARLLLLGDLETELAARGIAAIVHRP